MKRTLIALSLLLAATVAQAQLATKKALTLAAAKQMAAAAEAEARKNNWNMVIAIVDDGGHLIYLQKMDGTQNGSVQVAQDKARTSVDFKRPTKALEDAVTGGRNVVLKLGNATPIQGGLPVLAGTELIGGIGVSGGTSAQDEQVAAAGLKVVEGMK